MAKRKKDPSLAIAYIRVSTSKQAIGPEVQASQIESWCQTHGLQLSCPPFVERGVSGATEPHRRPMLLEALAALDRHGAGTLVAHRRDRFARDVDVIGNISLMLRRKGCRLCTTEQRPIDLSEIDPMARAMAGVQDVFAELERAMIRQRTIAALDVKRRRMERIGTVPYGFQLAKDGKTLVPDRAEQKIVLTIFKLRSDGLSHRKICARLAQMGMKTKKGGPWQASSIRRVLSRGQSRSDG